MHRVSASVKTEGRLMRQEGGAADADRSYKEHCEFITSGGQTQQGSLGWDGTMHLSEDPSAQPRTDLRSGVPFAADNMRPCWPHPMSQISC